MKKLCYGLVLSLTCMLLAEDAQVKNHLTSCDRHEQVTNKNNSELYDEVIDDNVESEDAQVTESEEAQVKSHLAPCNRHEHVINKNNSSLYDYVVHTGNPSYASTYSPQCTIFPQKQAAVVTCMDA